MSLPKPAVVAVDGGNSKTDLALVAEDGALLATARGPGMPPHLSEENVRIIADLLSSAAGMAGLDSGAGLAGIATQLVACVANVDLPEDERQLERMLAEQGWTQSTVVLNDTYAVLRAGLDDVPAEGADRPWGVAVTCGAGINCVGVAPDGRTAGYLALGPITGDWGGGISLGVAAQWHAIRAEDGRGPDTELARAVPAHFGLKTATEVAVALHKSQLGLGRLGELAPLVFEVSDNGDPVARKIILKLAKEIATMAIAVIKRLDLTSAAVPVVLGGGVLAANNPLLIGTISERVSAVASQAQFQVVEAIPVAGAALMGLDRIGAPLSATQQLRAAFAKLPAAVLTTAS
ncbi:MAG TPA: BadF/BadG/BcrA/BcrD ATPase family protein [Streptosporangiaceae bacterium]|nr:BadF/BadG/BcrA/BcrD ATPase family protein [Streptosporangiaceae bacterium]